MPPEFDYPEGITAIDAGYGRANLVAIHLLVEQTRAAIIDTGHNDSVSRVLAALAARGIARENVDWVILTHVHLDHAGGAGRLMSLLPNAQLLVHPRGARHMIDPRALFAATVQVYGEQQAHRLYGELIPVDAQRVVQADDGHEIQLAGRHLKALDTPGHARHHICLHDERTGHLFTGDTFGISYRELDVDGRAMIFPTTTPVQFDPQAMHASIDRIAALNPQSVYLTHFGMRGEVARLADNLHRLVDAYVGIARAHQRAGEDRHRLIVRELDALLLGECRRHGSDLPDSRLRELLAHDVQLNASGLQSWLDSRG
jgi:glyoxylase-like metal-dependent hydrolase (beta-lactamase superfamily II)